MSQNQPDSKNITVSWSDAHKYSPAPRHRRRLLINILKNIEFESCLDVGCAQPYLLQALSKRTRSVFGCDISDEVIKANRNAFPQWQFEEVDISKEIYPNHKSFDLVIASEVLEHIEDWRSAVGNLCKMSRRYLLLSMPAGQIGPMDNLVGHLQHYDHLMLKDEIEKNDFKVILYKYWGAPFHSLYKYFINAGDYKETYKNFASGKYGLRQKLIANFLYFLFYANNLFNSGSQLFVLAEKSSRSPGINAGQA